MNPYPRDVEFHTHQEILISEILNFMPHHAGLDVLGVIFLVDITIAEPTPRCPAL